jgi:hypothetical protein
LAKPLFGANAMSIILPIAVFPSLCILLRTENQNREPWTDDLNDYDAILGRYKSILQETYFSR